MTSNKKTQPMKNNQSTTKQNNTQRKTQGNTKGNTQNEIPQISQQNTQINNENINDTANDILPNVNITRMLIEIPIKKLLCNPDYMCEDKKIPSLLGSTLRVTLEPISHCFEIKLESEIKIEYKHIMDYNYTKKHDIQSVGYHQDNTINKVSDSIVKLLPNGQKQIIIFVHNGNTDINNNNDSKNVEKGHNVQSKINVLSKKQNQRILIINNEKKKVNGIINSIFSTKIGNKLNNKQKHITCGPEFKIINGETCSIILSMYYIFNSHIKYCETINFIKNQGIYLNQGYYGLSKLQYKNLISEIKLDNFGNDINYKIPPYIRTFVYKYLLAIFIDKLKMYVVYLNNSIINVQKDIKYLSDEYGWTNISKNFINEIEFKGFRYAYELKTENIPGYIRDGDTYKHADSYVLCTHNNQWNIFLKSEGDKNIDQNILLNNIYHSCKYNEFIRTLNNNVEDELKTDIKSDIDGSDMDYIMQEFPNYKEDEYFGGKKLLGKIQLSKDSITISYIGQNDIENFVINLKRETDTNFYKYIIDNKIIENGCIYDFNDNTFLKKLDKCKYKKTDVTSCIIKGNNKINLFSRNIVLSSIYKIKYYLLNNAIINNTIYCVLRKRKHNMFYVYFDGNLEMLQLN